MGSLFKDQIDFQKELVQKLMEAKDSPTKLAKYFFNFDAYDYNKEILECRDKYIVYRAGRKVGKSTTVALKAVHYAWFAPLLNEKIIDRCDILIVAPTRDQASIIFDMIAQMINRSDILKTYVVRKTTTELEIRFINGRGSTRIFTRAAGETGTSVRGYVPNIIIPDEAAFIKRKVMTALLPAGISTDAMIWMTSTPFGTVGYFYESCVSARAGTRKLRETMHNPDGFWIQFHVSSLENPMVKKNPMLLEELKKLSKEEYRQEILGEFSEAGNVLIPQELILQASGEFKLPSYVRFSIGVDVARSGKDETVYTVLAVDDDDRVYVVETISEGSSTTVEVVGKLGELCRKYARNLDVVYMDETGLGAGAVDLALSYGYPVRGTVFSLKAKGEMYNTLVQLFENARIKIGNNQKLMYQLSYLQKEYTLNNNLRIVSEQRDDFTDSLALACKAVYQGDSWHLLNGSIDDIA